MWFLLSLAAFAAGGAGGSPPPATPPPAPPTPVPPAPELAASTPPAPDASDTAARLAALEAQVAQLQADLFAAQAEALASDLPPSPPPARASFNALNPGITAFGDVIGQLGVQGGDIAPGSTIYLRSLEVELRADVDPFAKADAVIAWEQEAPPLDGGPAEGFGSEPEEAYVDLVALPARLSARVGKFRVPFGIINRTHPHDLPWTDAPELLGEEGYNDTGAVLSWLVPLGQSALTLTGGALAGTPFDEAGLTADLAGLARAELFVGTGPLGFSLGGSALADSASLQGPINTLVPSSYTAPRPIVGGDATFRWRPDPRRGIILMGEIVQDLSADAPVGYAAVQWQMARMWYLGARQDFGTPRTGVYLTGYTSEFLRLRVGAGFSPESGAVDALSQLTFVWGSHPVEPWWVNR